MAHSTYELRTSLRKISAQFADATEHLGAVVRKDIGEAIALIKANEITAAVARVQQMAELAIVQAEANRLAALSHKAEEVQSWIVTVVQSVRDNVTGPFLMLAGGIGLLGGVSAWTGGALLGKTAATVAGAGVVGASMPVLGFLLIACSIILLLGGALIYQESKRAR